MKGYSAGCLSTGSWPAVSLTSDGASDRGLSRSCSPNARSRHTRFRSRRRVRCEVKPLVALRDGDGDGDGDEIVKVFRDQWDELVRWDLLDGESQLLPIAKLPGMLCGPARLRSP
jgi:hypothetical protein